MYYTNQTIDITLNIVFDNELSMLDALSSTIQYKTPTGVKGEWIATVEADSVKVTVPTGTLVEKGKYYVWAKVDFGDNRLYYGTPSTIELYEPGTPVQ